MIRDVTLAVSGRNEYSIRHVNSQNKNSPTRPKKLLILGLDGATFDVLGPLMAEGRMPRLKEAVESGASGILRSTTPPITPAAWTTFLTGKQPGLHGIIDFERYDPLANKLSFNSTRCLDHVRNLWQILGGHGLRVGSLHVPMTYPPIPVNGFMITGFETPGPQSDFAYPPELKADVLAKWPDPTLRKKWKRKTFGGEKLFRQNVTYMSRSFFQGLDMTRGLGDRFGWDVLMVVLKLVDNLQHKTWKYIDPRWASRNRTRNEIVKECFGELDRAVGEFVDYARRNDAAVLMVSDHGHGSLEGKIQVNKLLQDWGYLHLRSSAVQGSTRLQYLLDRFRGKTKKFVRDGDVTHELAIDFDKTRACVMHAGMAGFVYINLKGRQPVGIVDPKQYESLRDEIRARLLGSECQIRDTQGRTIQLFPEVHKPEELYGVSREDQPWMPDLILIPHDSLAVVRRIRGNDVVQWLPYSKIEGTHRADGILIATGAGIAKKKDVRAHIVDCAPTILAMLGLPIPRDMQGRVVDELFESQPQIYYEEASAAISSSESKDVYNDRDLERVTSRLADLGYLE